MQNTDIFGVLAWSFFVGGLAFVILSHTLKNPLRAVVIHWCFLAGVAGIGVFSFFALLNLKPSSKLFIGLFVVLPALVCGILLSLQNVLSKAKNAKNKPNPSSKRDT